MRASRSSDDTSGRSQPCGDANQLAEDQTHGHHPKSHQPSAFEDMQHGGTVCRFLRISWILVKDSLITNDGSSFRDITSRIAKAASAMYRLSNPLFRKHCISIQTKINMYRALVVSVLLHGSEAWATTLADRRRLDVFDMRCQRRLLRVFWQQHISNHSIRERTNQLTASSLLRQRCLRWFGHLHACHPPSLLEESMTSTQTSLAGRDLEAAPKLDGPIQSSTISILLASTPPMLPRWSLANPSGRPLLADCLRVICIRSNPSKAQSSKSQVLHKHFCPIH